MAEDKGHLKPQVRETVKHFQKTKALQLETNKTILQRSRWRTKALKANHRLHQAETSKSIDDVSHAYTKGILKADVACHVRRFRTVSVRTKIVDIVY